MSDNLLPQGHDLERVSATDANCAGTSADALARDGAVVLVDTGLADIAHGVARHMLAELPSLLADEEDAMVYSRGHLRQYPPVGPGSRTLQLIANPGLVATAQRVLGPECYVANLMGHTVLPGSARQPVHADWGPLWNPPVDHPAFMLAYNIALVPTDAGNGAIELWPGTHRIVDAFTPGTLTTSAEAVARRTDGRPGVAVAMAPGDVLLRDVRTWHRGTHNGSDTPRPIVFGVIAAQWYRYDSTRPLAFPRSMTAELNALPLRVAYEFVGS